jgi:4-amino-4-deoxy-L-arabinose transferase-like glycosyltransferase
VTFAVAIRLIAIRQPFVDAWSWRQSDVAMIAENFARHGFNIFYPQVNWAGAAPGFVGTEFPLVPFIASLFYGLLGPQEWIGRSVSLTFFAVSLVFFVLLVRKASGERPAVVAGLLYAIAPLSIMASRAFMSDMASLALSLGAMYLFWESLDREASVGSLIVAAALGSLAILIKLPAIIIGIPLLVLSRAKYGARAFFMPRLWTSAAVAVVPSLMWYGHAYRISQVYEPHHLFGSGGIGIASLAQYGRILAVIATSSLTPTLFLAMLAGLGIGFRRPESRLFSWWFGALVLFMLLAGRGSRHEWYHLSLVPIAAFFASLAIEGAIGHRKLSGRSAGTVLAGVAFFASTGGLAYVYTRPLYEPRALPELSAGTAVERVTPSQSLILAVDAGNPTLLYYSRRRGWHFLADFGSSPGDDQQAIHELRYLRNAGARYIVFPRHSFWWQDIYPEFWKYLGASSRKVRESADYVILELDPSPDGGDARHQERS